ncbi:N [Weldona virus]|nr:N [Weldona virus] [Weldona virus]
MSKAKSPKIVSLTAGAGLEDDLVFSSSTRDGSVFDPRAGYENFIHHHGESVALLDNINAFLLNAKRAKDKLSSKSRKEATLKFGSWEVTVVNNHHKANAQNPVEPDDLTIGRISGYIARFLLSAHKNPKHKEEIERTIINPLAESKGITWKTPLLYMAMIPGSEMFMDEFKFYPLAIAMARYHKENMSVEYLKKPMRQMLSDGTKSTQWLVSAKDNIKKAFDNIMAQNWTKSGFSQVATQFLKEFNIN